MAKKHSRQPRQDAIQNLQSQAGIKSQRGSSGGPVCWLEERSRMISEAAYFRSERRGFAPGGELDDWIRAEAEIDRLMQSGGSRSSHSAGGI